MEKKNGFTLIELLAVIVVLAIIMVLTIPSVMDTMNTYQKNAFVLYVDKVAGAVESAYFLDSNGGPIPQSGYYVYDITTDLNLKSTGSFKGYVVVDASDVDRVRYYVTLYDNKFELVNYDVTTNGLPNDKTPQIVGKHKDKIINSPEAACGLVKAANNVCYTRKGYLINGISSDNANKTNENKTEE